MSDFLPELEDRLLRYVQIDTTSAEASATIPSTAIQFELLNLLADELRALGAQDVRVMPYGATLATIPSTVASAVPPIAFLAHVDTTEAYSGTNVKPIVHRNYDGSVITLPDDPTKILDPAQFPYLGEKAGDDIVTASGLTLLGADDKAGVVICMALANHFLANPDIPHGEIRICFTADEEIGRGVHANLPADLQVDAAYTLDGAKAGEVVYETFSADKATVTITGVSIHPGSSKNKMVNATRLAAQFVASLPKDQAPETTDGVDGFIHPYKVEGDAAQMTVHMILRDFERDGLAAKGTIVQVLANAIQQAEPRATVTCEISKQYRNMRYWLENDMRPVDLAVAAVEQIGLEPYFTPIRGGTDGSRLTEMGVPTPNLFTGMQNIHGPLEWVSLQDMEKSLQTCLNLAQLWVA
ncbi:MAG: peptidase T [Candidatus Promineifilaceae bacterium]